MSGIDPETEKIFNQAVEVLRELGASVVEIDGKPFRKRTDFSFFPGKNIETERHLYQEKHLAVRAYARANGSYGLTTLRNKHVRLSGDEIAERLDITPDNVYQRRARGLKKLGEILRDYRP